jgi:hypothetical protein
VSLSVLQTVHASCRELLCNMNTTLLSSHACYTCTRACIHILVKGPLGAWCASDHYAHAAAQIRHAGMHRLRHVCTHLSMQQISLIHNREELPLPRLMIAQYAAITQRKTSASWCAFCQLPGLAKHHTSGRCSQTHPAGYARVRTSSWLAYSPRIWCKRARIHIPCSCVCAPVCERAWQHSTSEPTTEPESTRCGCNHHFRVRLAITQQLWCTLDCGGPAPRLRSSV